MECSHLADGRCKLAEQVAKRELLLDLECFALDQKCEACPCKDGKKEPSREVLACVSRAIQSHPKDYQATWRAYINWQLNGVSRGLGDTIKKITRATGIDRAVKAIAGEGCGCDGRQSKLNAKFPRT